jgi:hypothetical protein
MAAPTNAHIADIHKAKQDLRPYAPSSQTFKNVSPSAVSGARTQNTMS